METKTSVLVALSAIVPLANFVIDIGGGRHDIAPGCSEAFQLNPHFSEVFVELGTGDVFSVAL